MQIDKYIAEFVKLRQTYGPGLEVMQLTAGSRTLTKAALPRIGHAKADNPRVLFSIANNLDREKGPRIVVLGLSDNKAREERKAPANGAERFAAMEGYNKRLGRGQV